MGKSIRSKPNEAWYVLHLQLVVLPGIFVCRALQTCCVVVFLVLLVLVHCAESSSSSASQRRERSTRAIDDDVAHACVHDELLFVTAIP